MKTKKRKQTGGANQPIAVDRPNRPVVTVDFASDECARSCGIEE